MRFHKNRIPSASMIGDDLPELYRGHEVAIHELCDDKRALSRMFGYEIEGL